MKFKGMLVAVAILMNVIFFYWFDDVARIGNIWNSQHHPRELVKVKLRNGKELSGSYVLNWQGEYVFSEETGKSKTFSNEDIEMLSKELPKNRRPSVLIENWRLYLPVGLFFGTYGLICFLILMVLHRRSYSDSRF